MPKVNLPANPATAVPTGVGLPTDGYKKAVVVSLLGTALIVSLHRSFKGSFPRPQVFIALLFIWIVLGFMAEFAPKLAAYFGGLVFTAVLIQQGPYVFQQINAKVQGGKQPTKQPVKPKSGSGGRKR